MNRDRGGDVGRPGGGSATAAAPAGIPGKTTLTGTLPPVLASTPKTTAEASLLAQANGAPAVQRKVSHDGAVASDEAVHPIQQRGGVQLKGGIDGGASDPHERHADQVADAVVAGRSAASLLDQMPGGAVARPAVQRSPLPGGGLSMGPAGAMGPVASGSKEDTPAWKKQAGSAKDYVAKYGQAIIDGLHAQLASVPFETRIDGVTWASGDAHAFAGQFALAFFMQRDDPWQFLVTTLAPDDVEPLIDKGRDALALPDMAKSYNPGVQIELGNVYKARIRDALLRVVPRYVGVWNQHVLAEETKLGKRPKDAAPPAAPEPAASEVRASTPIDPYVIRALATQLKVDFRRYRELHPAERQAHAIKGVDKVTLEIQWRKQAINWVRATPPEATAEHVAAELYGSETFAYLITPAAPLFGFQTDADSIAHLKPAYRDQLLKIQGNKDYHGSVVPEHGRPDDPNGQLLGGPLGDEAAKNQARDIKPTPNVSKAAIVERMRAIVGELDWLQQSVKPWGQEALLDAARHKVDRRSRELDKSSDPAAGGDWDGQSQVQVQVVQTARNAVQVAARQEEAFKSFPSARWLIVNLVRDYVEAAAISDLGATAQARLAAAEQKSRMFPADLMEALLDTFRPVIHSAKIKKTKLEGRAGDWDDARYGAGAMEKKELELRQGLAKVRDLLMDHPEKAKPELDRLLKEVTTLSTEVTLVSNMDSCDAAWAALDASLSKVGTAVSWVSSEHGNAPIKRDMAAVATMRLQWHAIYEKWKGAATPEGKKAAEDELSGKAKSKEWAELFETIRMDIADHETYDKWVTFGVMVGIAIVTGGIGAYVEAAAGAAWGAAAGFAASTAVEAATFTTLSQTLVQKDATLATFFDDFEKNLLMFGGLKAVGKVWGVTGKALGLEADEIAASGVLVQFAALNGTSLYDADREKRKHTGGQGLTSDEIARISFNNLAFLVAVSVGQRIAKPFLANLELEGQLQGQLLAARAAGARVEYLAKQVEAAKGKDPANAHQLNQALGDAIAKRETVLARLGEQVQLYEAGKKSALSKAQYDRVKAQIAEHAEQKADFERMQILDLLEPAGPNRFEVGGKAAMKRVVDHYGAEAALVGVDPVTGARTYEIRAKDTSPWRVTERVHAKPHETTKPPESTTAPGAAGPRHDVAPDGEATHHDSNATQGSTTHRVAAALNAHQELAIADIVELRRGLADGILKSDGLPQAVREKVFQGWKDVPESLRSVAEQTNFARVRNGKPGVIRSESELSNADVADSMNAQLQNVKSGQVDDMLAKFPEAQRENARQVLARASGFGRMESLNPLRAALQPHLDAGKKLYTPGSGSLADNLSYLSTKDTFKAHPDPIATTADVKPGAVVLLDDVVLARLKSDPAFAASLNQPGVVLVQPRGFTDGINMFNAGTPDVIAARTQHLVDRATKIQAGSGGKLSFDDAITQALDEHTRDALQAAKVTGSLEVVDPAAHPDLSSGGIAKQLNGDAGITEAQIADVLASVPEADRAMLRELMAQQSEVYSPRRITNDIVAQHTQIMATAAQRRIKPENVYFLIPRGEKSYGMMAMAHREATGTPVDHYINGAGEIAGRHLGSDTMVVVLDDVAGSGESLDSASIGASSSGYKGQIVISPMVSTARANKLFTDPNTGITSSRPNTSYMPGRIMSAIKESPYYKGLTEAQQTKLIKLLGGPRQLGFDDNGLSMAFPYMSPDNNNAMFGDRVAKNFIVNNNREAAKTGTWTPKDSNP